MTTAPVERFHETVVEPFRERVAGSAEGKVGVFCFRPFQPFLALHRLTRW